MMEDKNYSVEEVNEVTDRIIREFEKKELYGNEFSVKVEYKCGQYFEKVTYKKGDEILTIGRRVTDSYGTGEVMIEATEIQMSGIEIMKAYLNYQIPKGKYKEEWIEKCSECNHNITIFCDDIEEMGVGANCGIGKEDKAIFNIYERPENCPEIKIKEE